MADFVDDPRHRFSYELRPDGDLDHAIRSVAARLEAEGLLAAGASTAPRFHPHLTLLRADHADPDLVAQLAADLVGHEALYLDQVGAFGNGRIAWLAPDRDEALQQARGQLVDALGETHVDPLALARSPWTPHVTVAYDVAPAHREAVQAQLRDALPLRGAWRVAQAWDLDVRPTRCVAESSVS